MGVWGGGGCGLARWYCAGFRDGYPLCGRIKTEALESAAAAVAADYFAALEGYSSSERPVVSVVVLPCEQVVWQQGDIEGSSGAVV